MNSWLSVERLPSVNRCVLDASAILAIVNHEPGHEKLGSRLLSIGVASTVNLSEAHSKLVSLGWRPEEAWDDTRGLVSEGIEFDEIQARLTGDLLLQTRRFGLSFGDRACLALGLVLNAPIYTAERLWGRLSLAVPIHVIR
jgi:PIN domain nuclease of toxin-antitoxin system